MVGDRVVFGGDTLVEGRDFERRRGDLLIVERATGTMACLRCGNRWTTPLRHGGFYQTGATACPACGPSGSSARDQRRNRRRRPPVRAGQIARELQPSLAQLAAVVRELRLRVRSVRALRHRR